MFDDSPIEAFVESYYELTTKPLISIIFLSSVIFIFGFSCKQGDDHQFLIGHVLTSRYRTEVKLTRFIFSIMPCGRIWCCCGPTMRCGREIIPGGNGCRNVFDASALCWFGFALMFTFIISSGLMVSTFQRSLRCILVCCSTGIGVCWFGAVPNCRLTVGQLLRSESCYTVDKN